MSRTNESSPAFAGRTELLVVLVEDVAAATKRAALLPSVTRSFGQQLGDSGEIASGNLVDCT
jgi:hypothetical protein